MRHHQRGQAEGVIEPTDQPANNAGRNRIKPRKWLVIKHQHRIKCDSTGQRDATRHATGQLRRHQARCTAQAYRLQFQQDQIANHAFGQIGLLPIGKRHIVEDREIGKQGTELEQHPETGAQCIQGGPVEFGNILSIDQNLSLVGQYPPANQP